MYIVVIMFEGAQLVAGDAAPPDACIELWALDARGMCEVVARAVLDVVRRCIEGLIA